MRVACRDRLVRRAMRFTRLAFWRARATAKAAMNFSFRQLKAFAAVAQLSSFTKAAEQLHITQAGLSAMVRGLETQAGCRLFERTTRTVELTAAGRRLLPVAQRTLIDLAALADLDAIGWQARNRIRVGVTPLIACSVIPHVLQRFRERQPSMTVDVVDLDRAEIRRAVEHGELDAGFGAFFNRESGIRRRAIFPAHLVLAAPLRGRPRPVKWADIDVQALISLPADNAIQKMVDKYLRPDPERMRERRVVTHLETAMAMVEAGLGVAVMPSFAALASDRWKVRLSPILPRVKLDYYCITRAGRGASSAVDAFAETFAEAARARMA